MQDVVILSAARTAIGKFAGSLKDVPAVELGALTIREAVSRAKLDPKDIQECIMGNVLQAGLGQNPARQAAVKAGLPYEIGSVTINKVCGSGLKAVMLAANSIRAGEHEVLVAGGMENMNQAPYLLREARFGYRLNDNKIVDHMVNDGLWDSFNQIHMGMTAEICAERHNVKREEADELSLQSHMKAQRATVEGRFEKEIVPYVIRSKKGDTVLKVDEGIRPDTTMEALAKLRPAFKEGGQVTAGNSSQLSDGGAALVVASRKFAEERGIRPLASIIGYHTGGTRPEWIMEAPIPTTKELLSKLKMRPEEIDLFEHNEAFAAASVAVKRAFDIPDDKFNVNGGAVALGHPIGCSGARVLTSLIYALHDRKRDLGLATLCLGGGNAVSMVVRRE
ncbi:MAG: acetyl-CoA C-acetyltransferase [Methanomassiliicoccales archaeon]|nr:MAG: acetyl-CoA C-acetyltransferase [Methanomassiliicoccales archaeon]